MKALLSLLGTAFILGSFWGSAFVNHCLPDGWLTYPTAEWWALPMFLTLIAGTAASLSFGVQLINKAIG